MATTTVNIGLIKPDITDYVDINNFNSNADTIDAEFGKAVRAGGVLPNNTNLNDVYVNGTYLLSGDNTYANAPATWGILECISATGSPTVSSARFQRLTNSSHIWFRYCGSGGNWFSWIQII